MIEKRERMRAGVDMQEMGRRLELNPRAAHTRQKPQLMVSAGPSPLSNQEPHSEEERDWFRMLKTS